MRTVVAKLESTAPYSQGRHFNEYSVPRLDDRESDAAYERRTWRNKLHSTEEGNVFIPPMAFKNSLSEAAKYLSLKVKGKGQATYTKHFEAGLLVPEPVDLGIKVEDVGHEWLFVPSNGVRGNGKRVDKCFPVITKWSADVFFVVIDTIITEEVFEKHLETAGMFIGIGRFRPRNNGFYGRFKIISTEWSS